jgi:hypothetical protein
VAASLGIHKRTLQRRIAESGLALARPGRAPLLSEDDIAILLEATRRRKIAPSVAAARSVAELLLKSQRRRQTARLLKTSRPNV